MTDRGLTAALRQTAELGTDVSTAAKFLDYHQKLLHDIEVCRTNFLLSCLK